MVRKLAESSLRARKTPSSVHPAHAPKLPSSVESLYCAISSAILDEAISSFGSEVVTSQILYKPAILAIARVVFEGTRWEIYHERDVVHVVGFPKGNGMADWEENLIGAWDNGLIRSDAEGIAFYNVDPTHDFTTEKFETLQEEFVQFLLSNETLELFYNPHLKTYRHVDEDEEHFFARCLEELKEQFAPERQNMLDTIARQEDRVKERMEREVREHGARDGSDTIENLADARSINQQEMDAQETFVNREDIKSDMAEIQKEKEIKLQEFEENLLQLSRQQEKDILRVNHGHVKVLRFALVWLPYTEFVIQENESRRIEIIKSF